MSECGLCVTLVTGILELGHFTSVHLFHVGDCVSSFSLIAGTTMPDGLAYVHCRRVRPFFVYMSCCTA